MTQSKPKKTRSERQPARRARTGTKGKRRADRGPGLKGRSARSRASGHQPQRSTKRGLGGQQVEGRHAVRELLIAGARTVSEVTVNQDLDRSGIVEDVIHLAEELRVPLRFLPRSRVDAEATTESHQGVIAKAAGLKDHELDSLIAVPNAFLLILDGVTDPRNLGAILRSAECAGVTGVILGRHRAVHVTPAATKTAAGAVEYLPLCLVGGIPTTLSTLKAAEVTTIGLDGSGKHSIFDPAVDVVGPVALVLGAEGSGLSKLVKQRVDTVASIPLAGELASLNVGTAAAVACFEIVRRRNTELDIG